MIVVVIPAYKVKKHILSVIDQIGSEVHKVFVVDDACPETSGKYVVENCKDPRVKVLFHDANQGVGGAMVTGFRQCIQEGASIVVKIDGDGQMNPKLIPKFIKPLQDGVADYTKGNRFFFLESLQSMPFLRIYGNATLSFITKASTGYWKTMDPSNGFFAIHGKLLKYLPLEKLDRRFFFESDMLFRLNILRAVVLDIPMDSIYEDEKSNLSISKISVSFPLKHLIRFYKRIIYNYYLRDFNSASIQLMLGKLMILAGTLFGANKWMQGEQRGIPATSGTVMIATLPIILGFQMILAAIQYDVSSVPDKPIHVNLD